MSEDTDARQVLRKLNERLGTTTDPFARMKVEEYRNDLREAIQEVEEAKEQYRIIATGHKHVDTDKSAAMANAVEQQVEQAQEQVEGIASFLEELLTVADEDPDTDLREWMRAKKQQQLKQAQQAQAMGVGPQ